MANALEYVEPSNFIRASRQHTPYLEPEEIRLDDDGRWLCFRTYEQLAVIHEKNAPQFARAVAAWYLKASGLSYAAIASLFELSASRTGDIVKDIQNRVYRPAYKKQWDAALMKTAEKRLFPTVSAGVQLAHRATQITAQMRDAECLMYLFPRGPQVASLNSGALRIGRSRLDSLRLQVGEYRCTCDDCGRVTLAPFETKELWLSRKPGWGRSTA